MLAKEWLAGKTSEQQAKISTEMLIRECIEGNYEKHMMVKDKTK